MRKEYCKPASEFSIGEMSISITHDTEEKDLLFKGLIAVNETENLVYVYRRFHCLMSQKARPGLEVKKAFWEDIGNRLNAAQTTPQVRQMVHMTAGSDDLEYDYTWQIMKYLDQYTLKFPDREKENFYYRFFLVLLDDPRTFLELEDYHYCDTSTLQKVLKTFMYFTLDEQEYWMMLYAMKGGEIPDLDRSRFKFPDLDEAEKEAVEKIKEKLQENKDKIYALLAR